MVLRGAACLETTQKSRIHVMTHRVAYVAFSELRSRSKRQAHQMDVLFCDLVKGFILVQYPQSMRIPITCAESPAKLNSS